MITFPIERPELIRSKAESKAWKTDLLDQPISNGTKKEGSEGPSLSFHIFQKLESLNNDSKETAARFDNNAEVYRPS